MSPLIRMFEWDTKFSQASFVLILPVHWILRIVAPCGDCTQMVLPPLSNSIRAAGMVILLRAPS